MVVPAYPVFTVEGQGEIRPAFGPYIVGQSLLIGATPASGWTFTHFLRNGIVAATDNPHNFLNLQESETFTAVFSQPPDGNGGNGTNTQWIVPALFIGLVVGIGVYGFWRYRK